MQDSLKLGISLLILTSVFLISVSVWLFFAKEIERDKRISMEVQLSEIMSSKDDIQDSLDDLRVINKDLEAKLAGARAEIKGLKDNYEKEKKGPQAGHGRTR